jgi:hypothetical protein
MLAAHETPLNVGIFRLMIKVNILKTDLKRGHCYKANLRASIEREVSMFALLVLAMSLVKK